MYNKKFADKIVRFLNANPAGKYNMQDLAAILHIGKHDYRYLQTTLNSMVKEKIIKRQRKYFSSAEDGKQRYRRSESKVLTSSKPAEKSKLTRTERRMTKSGDTRIAVGKFDATPLSKNASFAFVITKNEDIFISGEDVGNAYHNDLVEVEILYRKGGGEKRAYGIVTDILERHKTTFTGRIEGYKNKFLLICDNPKVHRSFQLDPESGLKSGQKAFVEVYDWGDHKFNISPRARVKEILGMAGEPDVEFMSVIREYDLPLDFPEEVLEAAQEISPEIPEEEYKRRQDFRDLQTFTIDPVSAKDYDDAISLELNENDFNLYVHIADVSHYITKETPIYHEAVNRGNSFYFPRKVIPMLPEALSNGICSLRPYEEKLTMTVKTTFDFDFNIKAQKLYESIIKSDYRFAYEDIDKFFDGDKTAVPDEFYLTLEMMLKLSQKLSEKRRKQGALYFDLPEVEFKFDELGYLGKLTRSKETDSHLLVENFMLIANEFVAQSLESRLKRLKRKQPLFPLFRIHEDPEERKVSEILNLLKTYKIPIKRSSNMNLTVQNVLAELPSQDFHRVFDRKILRSMKKAKYSIMHKRHFGLAMETYTHFTSPIRRLCDLVIHQLCKSFLLNSQTTKFTQQELINLAEVASKQEILADEAERSVNRINVLSFLKDKVGEEFTGLVTGMNNSNLFIELDDIPVSGVLPMSYFNDDYYVFYRESATMIGKRKNQKIRLADRLSVRIERVDDDLYLGLVQDNVQQDSGRSGDNRRPRGNYKGKDSSRSRGSYKDRDKDRDKNKSRGGYKGRDRDRDKDSDRGRKSFGNKRRKR